MHKFTMTEISAVDRPAQAHATVVLMKRADDVEKKLELVSETNGHVHLIDIDEFAMARKGGHTSHDGDHSHPFVIDASGNITIGVSHDHTHSIELTAEQIMQKRGELTDSDEKKKKSKKESANPFVDKSADGNDGESNNGGNPMPQSKDDAAKLQKAVDEIDGLKKSLATSIAIAEFSDEHKTYYKGLSDSDKEVFIAKSSDDRQLDVDNARAEDPVMYKSLDGTEYRKSDDDRLIKMAKGRDADRRELKAEIAKRENVELEKRAETELGNLPGKKDVHIAMLKSIDGITDAGIRSEALKAICAGNTAMAKNFKRNGVNGGDGEGKSALEELDTLAKSYAKDNKVNYHDAYAEVCKTEEGSELYTKSLN